MKKLEKQKPWLYIVSGFVLGALLGLGLLMILGVLDLPALLTGSVGEKSPGSAILDLGSPAPDFELIDLDGNTVKLADLQGKLVVINFWATWCAPCRMEMPEFENNYQRYTPDLVVLGVNLEQSPEDIQEFLDQLSISYPILLDTDGRVSRLYQVIQLPNTYFIDRQGIIQIRHIGYLSSNQFIRYLERLGLEK